VKTATPETPLANWLAWTLPSLTDVLFVVVMSLLAFSSLHNGLLRDPDTGWHIRSGELIWATKALPGTDPFSYTRHGQPWYAWEWSYDVVIAAIHHDSGLNGVVLSTAIIIGCTFALLFQSILRRCGNLGAAGSLTMLAFAAAQVHMLARPHVLSWLFTVLWMEILFRFEDGRRSALLRLPPLMLLWVNLHGGFILGLALLGIFTAGNIGAAFASSRQGDKILPLASAFLACGITTLLTPYGYKLHIHVYQYLSHHFLMDNIEEFTSPNFHLPGYRYFELFFPLVIVGAMFSRRRISFTHLLLILFSLYAGLLAVRNIPIAAIIMSFVLGPVLAAAFSTAPDHGSCPGWLRGIIAAEQSISANIAGLEKQFRGHAWSIIAIIASAALVLNGGRMFSHQVMTSRFDKKILPIEAAEFIAQKHPRPPLQHR
jgi:hypothetical protein